jgi:hypothetical protein
MEIAMGKNIIYCTAGTLELLISLDKCKHFIIRKALGMNPYFAMVTLECILSPPKKCIIFYLLWNGLL